MFPGCFSDYSSMGGGGGGGGEGGGLSAYTKANGESLK